MPNRYFPKPSGNLNLLERIAYNESLKQEGPSGLDKTLMVAASALGAWMRYDQNKRLIAAQQAEAQKQQRYSQVQRLLADPDYEVDVAGLERWGETGQGDLNAIVKKKPKYEEAKYDIKYDTELNPETGKYETVAYHVPKVPSPDYVPIKTRLGETARVPSAGGGGESYQYYPSEDHSALIGVGRKSGKTKTIPLPGPLPEKGKRDEELYDTYYKEEMGKLWSQRMGYDISEDLKRKYKDVIKTETNEAIVADLIASERARERIAAKKRMFQQGQEQRR